MKQSQALDILKMGHNVYLTGAPGAGKTHVLREFISYLKEHSIPVAVTASTGIAATHLHGMTIHSWAGLGILDSLSQHDIEQLLKKSTLKKRFRETKVLLIDEVSMLHGKRLDMLDELARAFKDETKPFGGLQVVLSGDLFQLPPVSRDRSPDFVFTSHAWNHMNLRVCYLQEQHRQDDSQLLDILSAIRSVEVDDSHIMALQDRFRELPSNRVAVKLYTHNSDVDGMNQEELLKIDEPTKTYQMHLSGNKKIAAALAQNCLAPETLELKVGAEVMFVANAPSGQFVNGTIGRVTGFDDDTPIVQTADKTIYVSPHTWKLQDGVRVVAEVEQLPLRLAWAITVHKSQGMSLDAIQVDLERSFEPGMGYVALSRVSTLDGLYIKGMNNTALIVHPDVSELDAQLITQSEHLVEQLASIPQKQAEELAERVRVALQPDEVKELSSYDQDLFEELREWRASIAKQASVPPYVVLNDKTLKHIAARAPKNRIDLIKIHGIGDQKYDRYGEAVLEIVQKNANKNVKKTKAKK